MMERVERFEALKRCLEDVLLDNEVLTGDAGRHVGIVAEEGKRLGLEPNALATQLARELFRLRPGDHIVGPMLVVGTKGAEFSDADAQLVLGMVAD